MKVKIEDYRGWEISFDSDKEVFYCYSDSYDKDGNNKSYSATKKFIDDFIKDNEVFKPVWIDVLPNSFKSDKKVKVVGIRKDGRFVYEDKEGKKHQISDYEEKDYIIYNSDNDKFRVEADKIQNRIDALQAEKRDVLKNITGVLLSDYKKSLNLI